jgi:hypothetical protein
LGKEAKPAFTRAFMRLFPALRQYAHAALASANVFRNRWGDECPNLNMTGLPLIRSQSARSGSAAAHLFDETAHPVLLLLDGLDQLELGAAAVEVVSFTIDFEVSIAGKEIG